MKNKYRQRFALIVSFVLSLTYTSPIFSQNEPLKTISGTITGTDGVLSGVNISVKYSNHGSTSDFEGKYSLLATATDTLIFTYLGYKRQEMAVGNKNVVDVLLETNATALDQVIINAGYYKVSNREKTGSISRVGSKEIENQPVDNPLAALQGRLPGVAISPTTGLPGGGYKVRIRGQSSIAAGNEPLYVIDGVPYSSESLSSTSVSGAILPFGNLSPLSLINPNDIESVEVLKDADATAIYGSRGSNGVILITTKKGKAGETTFRVSSSTAAGHIARPLKLLHTEDYLAMRQEAFSNDGITEYPSTAYDVNGTWDQNRYTDWQKELIGETAQRSTWEASVSGGGEQNRFLISGGTHNETTVFIGDSKYSRATVRTQFSHQSKDDRFKLGFSSGYTIEDNQLPASDLSLQARNLPPNAPALYDKNGALNFENSTFNNPLTVLETDYRSKRNNLISSLNLNYALSYGFSLQAQLGYQNSILDEYRTRPSTIYDPAYGLDSRYSGLTRNNGMRKSWLAEPQINWEREIGKGRLSVLFGGSFQQEESQVLTISAFGFPSNDLIHNLSAANLVTITNDNNTLYKYEAIYGRINYNLKQTYFLNLTGRRDGSSRFGPANRFANFGAIGAAWLFSEEKFIKDLPQFFSYGKLRASYGSTGNDQIGDYQYLDTYTITANPYNGTIGLAPTQLYNPNFGWEVNKKFEVALEMGLFENRIYFTGAYYRNRSSNQLVGIPLPGTTGFSSVQGNLDATVENTGVELSLRTENFKGGEFRWSTDFNITFPKNKLISFPGLNESTYANQYVIGEPLTIQKLYHFTGVNTQTGLYEFEDYNGDGVIDSPDDRQFVADIGPKYYGGMQNTFSMGPWELGIFLNFSKQKAFNYLLGASPPGVMVNQSTEVLNHWQNPGDDVPIQLYTSGENPEAVEAFYQYAQSDASISDASYIRLKNVSIKYTIPINGVTCTLFAEGQNLLTITSFKSGDPEQLSGFLSPVRWISGGLNLKF